MAKFIVRQMAAAGSDGVGQGPNASKRVYQVRRSPDRDPGRLDDRKVGWFLAFEAARIDISRPDLIGDAPQLISPPTSTNSRAI